MLNENLRISESLLQVSVVSRIKNQLLNGRIPQTYLFSGPESTGRKTMARALAATLLCRKNESFSEGFDACRECESCRAVASDCHPDLNFIYPMGNDIKVSQIRAMQKSAELKPLYGKWRFIVICQADSLNESSGNCILKILEESPPSLIFVLIAANEKKILPTILSRSEHIVFRSPSHKDVREYIVKRYNINSDITARYYAQSLGKPGKTIEWLTDLQGVSERSSLALPEAQTAYIDQLANISGHFSKIFSSANSLDGLTKIFNNSDLLETSALANARREFCLGIIAAPLLPASFPLLFSRLMLETLDQVKSEVKKEVEKFFKSQKENYSSGILKELEDGAGYSVTEIAYSQIDSFLLSLSAILADMLYSAHSTDEEILLNIDEKEFIINSLKFHGLPRVEAKLRTISLMRNYLRRYVNPGLILENILSDFGGRLL
ncbi:MAG: hypothetical protein HQM10_19850 [Candidatus Riflebacteria bacterium]|nr:hypothetical protein [Candidatus Riflebacteria bacterium]